MKETGQGRGKPSREEATGKIPLTRWGPRGWSHHNAVTHSGCTPRVSTHCGVLLRGHDHLMRLWSTEGDSLQKEGGCQFLAAGMREGGQAGLVGEMS